MKKEKELVKNTFIILFGKLCTQFLSFLLLPLYTSVLEPSEYGVADLITTYVTLIIPVITLQLEMALFRELIDVRNNKSKQREIVTSGICGIIFNLLISIILISIVNIFISIPFKLYIILTVASSIFSNLLLQIARGRGDTVGYSVGSMVAAVSTIGCNILFLVVLNFKIEGLLLSTALGNLLASIFMFFRCKIYDLINFKYISKKQLKLLLKYSIPLVPNGLIWWIINASDRTLITLFIGTASNGIYAVANKFSNILIQLFNVFNLSWTESASLHIGADDKNNFFSRIFNAIIKLFASICIMLICTMFILFPIIINKEFNEAYIYIPLLLIGMFFNVIVSFIGSVYIALKKTREVAKTSLYASILNIIINVLLINKIGIYAAAISTIVAFLIMSIYRYLDIQKYVILKIECKTIVELIIIFIISITVYYINNIFVSILSLIIIMLYLIYINKNILLKIAEKLLKKYNFKRKNNVL